MRILLINGSPRKNGNTHTALKVLEAELLQQRLEVEWFHVGNKPVRGCIGCLGCVKNNRCVFTDDSCNALIDSILAADGVIVGSPVYFAGPNGALCSLFDRAFYATCTRDQLFKGKAAAALVSCEWTGGTAALDRLHRYFIPCQMSVVSNGDYTVFMKDAVKREESRALELLAMLAVNMSAQLLKKAREVG